MSLFMLHRKHLCCLLIGTAVAFQLLMPNVMGFQADCVASDDSVAIEWLDQVAVVKIDAGRVTPGASEPNDTLPVTVDFQNDTIVIATLQPEVSIKLLLIDRDGASIHYGVYALEGAKVAHEFPRDSFADLIGWNDADHRDAVERLIEATGYDPQVTAPKLESFHDRWVRPGKRVLCFLNSAALPKSMHRESADENSLVVLEIDLDP